eukprot:6207765-Pleurochrysis_carterae.AAC.1
MASQEQPRGARLELGSVSAGARSARRCAALRSGPLLHAPTQTKPRLAVLNARTGAAWRGSPNAGRHPSRPAVTRLGVVADMNDASRSYEITHRPVPRLKHEEER